MYKRGKSVNRKALAIELVLLFIISIVVPITIGNIINPTEKYNKYDFDIYHISKVYNNERQIYRNQVADPLIFNESVSYKGIAAPPSVLGPMESPWPIFGHDIQHTGRSSYNTTENLGGTKWAFKTSGPLETSPAIDNDGTIYVADWDYLYAVYPNGSLKWRSPHGGITGSSPAIGEDGTIYYGADNGNLYAINSNGTTKWIFSQGGSIYGAPTLSKDGTIYFETFSENGKFYAVNPNGTEKWHYNADFYCETTPVIADNGTIYFASHVFLYSFYPNGTLIWKTKLGDPNFTFLGCPTLGDDGTIYIPCDPSYLLAINPNGTIKWRSSIGWGSWAAPSIGLDGTIYIGYQHMFAFYPNGTLKWIFMPNNDEWHSIDSKTYAISADGTIFIGTYTGSSGSIFALNPNGTEKWSEYLGNDRVLSSPAIASDGTVYIGCSCMGTVPYGVLYAFNGKKFDTPVLEKPKVGKIYLCDKGLKLTISNTIIIGKITITVSHPDPKNVSRVDFYIDGVKRYEATSPPYQWTWTDHYKIFRLTYHNIRVTAVNVTGMEKTVGLSVNKLF